MAACAMAAVTMAQAAVMLRQAAGLYRFTF
jgi:hypothetical protein